MIATQTYEKSLQKTLTVIKVQLKILSLARNLESLIQKSENIYVF